MIQAIENMNEFYKNIRIDFIHQTISIPAVAMSVSIPSLILQQNFISLTQRIKIFISCSKRTLSVVQASFSADTMNLVKPLFKTMQTSHVRKSSAMMRTGYVCGV